MIPTVMSNLYPSARFIIPSQGETLRSRRAITGDESYANRIGKSGMGFR